MQFRWQKSRDGQLDLLDQEAGPNSVPRIAPARPRASERAPATTQSLSSPSTSPPRVTGQLRDGRPLHVPISLLQEDANNPRTEFAEVDLESLVHTSGNAASCSRSSCILQMPLVDIAFTSAR